MAGSDERELTVRPPSLDDTDAFVAAVHRSRGLHGLWVQPPADAAAFQRYVRRSRRPEQASYLAWVGDEPAAVVNLNDILRGALQGACAGYYAFAPHAGTGVTKRLLSAALDEAFGALHLHRIEANIQPGNERSKGLVAALGFRYEGFSPRYLLIAGEWRDHERWAILADEWRLGVGSSESTA